MRRLDYRDTEKKLSVDIYGLQFKIKRNELENVDTKKLSEEENLEEAIDRILGEGSSEKINEKRIADGYEKMDTGVALTILAFITDVYVESSIQPISKTIDRYDKYNRKIDNVKRGRYNRRH